MQTHTRTHTHTRSALRAHCESFIQAEFLKFSEHRRRCGKTANWFCLFNFVKLALQIKSGTFVLNCRVNNTTRMSCTSLSLSLCPHTHAACNSSAQLTQFWARARVHAQRTCNCYVTVEQTRYITKTEERERYRKHKTCTTNESRLRRISHKSRLKKKKKSCLRREQHMLQSLLTFTLALSLSHDHRSLARSLGCCTIELSIAGGALH